jgi:hypothetical protein
VDSKTKRILQFGLFAIAGVWLLALVAFVHDRFARWRVGAFEPALLNHPGDGPLPVLWNVPAFSARDQDGQAVTNKALDNTSCISPILRPRWRS